MPYSLTITEQAAKDLEHESDYSAQRWGKGHAKKYIRELAQKIKGLAQNPYLFRTHHDVLPGLRMMAYKGNHIFYSINEPDKQVFILRITSIYRQITLEDINL